MMSPRDKGGNESRALPDHDEEQPAQARIHRTAGRSDRPGSLTLQPIVSVSRLSKTYASGFQALDNIDLKIRRGEIFALLGPNGAGKTTLINIICGIVNPTQGVIMADGHDIVSEYRAARSLICLLYTSPSPRDRS